MNKPIISFFVLILSVGFTFFYVVPAYNLNKKVRGDILILSKILSTSGEIKKLISETKTNLNSIEPAGLSRFEVFLPEKIDKIRFANNIQYIGRKNRIILSDIKVEEPANGSSSIGTAGSIQGLVNTVSLGAQIDKAQGADTRDIHVESFSSGKYVATKASFTFTSTFETFQLFLDDLEKSLGVIDVVSLSFTSTPEDISANRPDTPLLPIYQYAMSVVTYSLK
ncbi:MAG: hypothetical protein WAV98_03280 [Minisyncoccia bacterium]